jgi:epoxyqueuosine reductase QueG
LKPDLSEIASFDRFEGSPKIHLPQDLLPGAKPVISIAFRVLPSLVNWRGRFDRFKEIPDSVLIPNASYKQERYLF